MTDTALYRNISLKNKAYNRAYVLSKKIFPEKDFSIAETLDILINREFDKKGYKDLDKGPVRRNVGRRNKKYGRAK